MKKTAERAKPNHYNGDLVRESVAYRRGVAEGYKRGFREGFEHSGAQDFQAMADYLRKTLEKLQAEGKTLTEAIEILNK